MAAAERVGSLGLAEAPASAPAPAPAGRLGALLAAARPRQWVKNLLVLAAPAAAGVLDHRTAALRTLGAVVAFTLASVATYLVNDVLDAEADRHHPHKRLRPVASGRLPARLALAAAAASLVAGLGLALAVGGPALLAVVGVYLAVTLAYSLGLKRVAYLELACVSAGFVLRAVAGGAAAHVPISPWFALVSSAGALLVVAGKRGAELLELGSGGRAHRAVLARYSPGVLSALRLAAGAIAATAYLLWAFAASSHLAHHDDVHELLFRLSALPFLVAVAVVLRALERGEGGAPEELALRNHALQAAAASCVALVIAGIYA